MYSRKYARAKGKIKQMAQATADVIGLQLEQVRD
jgi:hypothetical protein